MTVRLTLSDSVQSLGTPRGERYRHQRLMQRSPMSTGLKWIVMPTKPYVGDNATVLYE
jgi:hypothetical protein